MTTTEPPVEPAPPPARPARAGASWDTDRIVALSAMAVGLCTLFITLYQTYLARQAQSASVYPYLVFAINSTDEGVYITLRNDGVGPAMVEDLHIGYRGRDYQKDPYAFFIEQRPEAANAGGGLTVDRVMGGRLIPAGATVQMLGGGGGPERNKTLLTEVLRLFAIAEVPQSWLVAAGATNPDKAVIEITYTSVYGDRWRLRSDQAVPQPF
jgi:hypothetical protein